VDRIARVLGLFNGGGRDISLRRSFLTISGSQAAYCQMCTGARIRKTHIYIVPRLRMRGVVPQIPRDLLREIYFKITLKGLLLSS